MPNPESPAKDPAFLNVLDWAIGSYRHAEALMQSRIYNYLVAASILFLAWATVYASPQGRTRILVLITLASFGTVFSIFWYLLALRQRHFFTVTMDTIIYLESFLAVEEFRTLTAVSRLQKDNPVQLLTENKTVKLGFLESKLSSRSLGTLSPAIFGIAFLILVLLSVF